MPAHLCPNQRRYIILTHPAFLLRQKEKKVALAEASLNKVEQREGQQSKQMVEQRERGDGFRQTMIEIVLL